MIASILESTGTLLTILTPLVAVPLTVITFYLRSLREHQVTWHGELIRRVEAVEKSVTDLRNALFAFERDYTTKEEWLRECMLARQTLAQLTEASVRIETTLNGTKIADPCPLCSGDTLSSPVLADRRELTESVNPGQGNR